MSKYYWDDFAPGWTFESETRSLSAEDIKRFAREYDPQVFHTDEEAAKATPFGGLIASGWQTCGVMMRLMCDGYLVESACLGSPGTGGAALAQAGAPGRCAAPARRGARADAFAEAAQSRHGQVPLGSA